MAVAKWGEEIDLGPQSWCAIRNHVPMLCDEAQVYHPLVEDLGVRHGVNLEDFHQRLDGEFADWGGERSGTSEGDIMINGLRHIPEILVTIRKRF